MRRGLSAREISGCMSRLIKVWPQSLFPMPFYPLCPWSRSSGEHARVRARFFPTLL
jgi:hypothetical protein